MMTDRITEVTTAVKRVQALDPNAREALLFMLVGRMSVENINDLRIDIEQAERMGQSK